MWGGQLWGTLFFIFMSFAALSTVIGVFENIVAFCMDQWGVSRRSAVAINAVLIIVLSVPCILGFNVWQGVQFPGIGDIQSLEDFIVSNNVLPLGGLVYVLFCTSRYGWGWKNFLTEANTGKISVSDATAHAACLTAKDVNASAIVTVSESGTTARLLSKYRPAQPIIACVMKEQVQRQLALSWGITPLMMPLAHSTDELIEMSTSLAKENGYLHNGELAVVTAGVPVGISGTTNMIKIHMVGNCLATGVGVGPENSELTNATGKACVCRTLEEIRAKFKPGMVLVVPSTSNEMLSYVRDAAALVVEEPGLNSHAAIAGKALLKPTIVGATGATNHIRDGLVIAVDCAHGSVQRLQA